MPNHTDLSQNPALTARMRAVVQRLSDADLSRELPGGWTVASVLAHVAFWDSRALALLERWEREGIGPSPLPDVDALNDAARPLLLALPPRAAADQALSIAGALDRRLEALTPEQLSAIEAAGPPFGLVRGHRTEHLNQIEALFPAP
ncbi:MAG: maleylpyruvate isomerase N-terminal domain-containing protein [Chloroflexi bacterium]|nr:maleylpyruvate isomerase N-terminal domain-containing protein [Chloroflexota bacterium]